MDKAFKSIALKIETEQDMSALMQILDWAARHGGVQAATPVAVFIQKIDAARIEAARVEGTPLAAVA